MLAETLLSLSKQKQRNHFTLHGGKGWMDRHLDPPWRSSFKYLADPKNANNCQTKIIAQLSMPPPSKKKKKKREKIQMFTQFSVSQYHQSQVCLQGNRIFLKYCGETETTDLESFTSPGNKLKRRRKKREGGEEILEMSFMDEFSFFLCLYPCKSLGRKMPPSE